MAGQDGSVGSATGLDVLDGWFKCQETSTETLKIRLFFKVQLVKTNLPLITYKWLYMGLSFHKWG